MKKYNGLLIFAFSLVLFLGSVMFGYNIMSKNSKDDPLIVEQQGNENDLEIVQEKERISPNTFIEHKTNYKDCDHSIVKLFENKDEVVNMTEDEYMEYMEENFPNIKIISFSSKEIILIEERNHLCPNHYIIGQSDGNIAIYRTDENGDRYLYKTFKDYPIATLKEIDQQRLIEGIVVDSEEELSNVIENFIS